jgi:hypothetical protein
MGKKKKQQKKKTSEWGEWVFVPHTHYAVVPVAGMSEDDERQAREFRKKSLRYENNVYQVNITDVKDGADNSWQWLSIKRRDRGVVRDWRHLQRIKNDLCGAEREAIEIYPAESELIDTANQFHLWVMPEGMNAPVGFRYGRDVMTPSEAEKVGARQRPFTEG